MKALEWGGKEGFNAAEDEPWTLTTGLQLIGNEIALMFQFFEGETAGRLRTYENFQFLQVYDAGHMVPMDKPQAASEMLNSFLEGSLGRDLPIIDII